MCFTQGLRQDEQKSTDLTCSRTDNSRSSMSLFRSPAMQSRVRKKPYSRMLLILLFTSMLRLPKLISSLNFLSKEIIELYDAASEISIALYGAVRVFCILLFCLVVNELHWIQWPRTPLTIDTQDGIYDANINTLSTKAENAILAEDVEIMINSVIYSVIKIILIKWSILYIWKAVYPNAESICLRLSLCRDCDLLV